MDWVFGEKRVGPHWVKQIVRMKRIEMRLCSDLSEMNQAKTMVKNNLSIFIFKEKRIIDLGRKLGK